MGVNNTRANDGVSVVSTPTTVVLKVKMTIKCQYATKNKLIKKNLLPFWQIAVEPRMFSLGMVVKSHVAPEKIVFNQQCGSSY